MTGHDERWPFRSQWTTYDHVTFVIYSAALLAAGALSHWVLQ